MDSKSAFKRGPWNTLKILISVLKHSAQHIIVKLLQGVAWDELLISIPLHPAPPTLIWWEWVWVGCLLDAFTAHFMQVGQLGSPMFGARVSGKEDIPRTPTTHTGGERLCWKWLRWVWFLIFQLETKWVWLLGVSLRFLKDSRQSEGDKAQEAAAFQNDQRNLGGFFLESSDPRFVCITGGRNHHSLPNWSEWWPEFAKAYGNTTPPKQVSGPILSWERSLPFPVFRSIDL